MRSRLQWSIQLLLLASLCLAPTAARAHPHSWIAAQTAFHLDEQGRLARIDTRWEFDQYYSLITLADLLTEYGDRSTGLPAMAQRMVRNLEAHRYFSSLSIAGRALELPTPSHATLETVGTGFNELLVLRMSFELPLPQPIHGREILWQVYDPSFYIAMAHGDQSEVSIHQSQAGACHSRIEFPEVSDELLAYAAALDRQSRGTPDLGQKFAERILIRCQASDER